MGPELLDRNNPLRHDLLHSRRNRCRTYHARQLCLPVVERVDATSAAGRARAGGGRWMDGR